MENAKLMLFLALCKSSSLSFGALLNWLVRDTIAILFLMSASEIFVFSWSNFILSFWKQQLTLSFCFKDSSSKPIKACVCLFLYWLNSSCKLSCRFIASANFIWLSESLLKHPPMTQEIVPDVAAKAPHCKKCCRWRLRTKPYHCSSSTGYEAKASSCYLTYRDDLSAWRAHG